jgi:hypothetical protein
LLVSEWSGLESIYLLAFIGISEIRTEINVPEIPKMNADNK